MRTLRLVPIAAAVILAVNLIAGSGAGVSAAQGNGSAPCVAVSGGTVQNATVVDVAADGGTAIGDASGGNGNTAATFGNNNRNHRKNNRNDWSAESLQSLEERLLQTETASAGNGGVATASADGGAVSIGDINSGGNVGNAISVGDTVCAGAAPKPSGGGGGHAAPSGGGGGGRGGQVRALPSTGVGALGGADSGSLILALGALGMLGLSLGSRLERRVSGR
jgi:hypothetical protein